MAEPEGRGLKVSLDVELIPDGEEGLMPDLIIDHGSAVIQFRRDDNDEEPTLMVHVTTGVPLHILASLFSAMGRNMVREPEEVTPEKEH